MADARYWLTVSPTDAETLAPDLRETVLLVRTIIERAHTGELAELQGASYRMDLRGLFSPPPVRPTIPIFLSPLFRKTVELAAEVGDGIVGHPIWTPRWVTDE